MCEDDAMNEQACGGLKSPPSQQCFLCVTFLYQNSIFTRPYLPEFGGCVAEVIDSARALLGLTCRSGSAIGGRLRFGRLGDRRSWIEAQRWKSICRGSFAEGPVEWIGG